MKELERILLLSPEERSAADLEYLEKHADEMTDEQKSQLEKETADKVAEEKRIADEQTAKEEAEAKEKEAKEKKEAAEKKQKSAKSVELSMESKDLGEGEVETVIASNILDRHGEKIDIDGMDTKKYMKDPVVLWAHDYSALPIARATKLWKEGGKLFGKIKFAIAEYPFAKTVYELIKGGFLSAVSIGFIPSEMEGNMYTKSEMIEFSVVPVPANPEALIYAKKLGLDISKIQPYHKNTMHNLKDILAKSIEDLTVGEIKFLKENSEKLTAEETKKFSSVLEERDVVSEMKAIVEEAVKPMKEDIAAIKAIDPVIQKDIRVLGVDLKKDYSKEAKFMFYVQGVKSKDFTKYRAVMKDAMNTTDDNEVMPPQEFIAEVERLEELYGVAVRFATVRRSTNGSGIRVVQGDDDLEMYDTSEGVAKKSSKNSYANKTLLWRKFAGILPLTDELNEDSAINLWNDATNRFARARSKQQDQLVFTEVSNISPKNHGILNVAGTNLVTLSGDSIEDLEYDDLSKMIFGVPTGSGATGSFFLKRDILGVIQRIKDLEGRPVWQRAMADGTPATILGRPYVETEVLPGLTDDEEDLRFMVYGDLKYSTLGIRKDLEIKIFDTGTVGDPDEVDQDANTLNLLTQDMQAMRGVTRINAMCRFPTAFSVAKTAATS
jgi:HK97 family phage major capsid protein/HK97 family phage prohead protease